MCLIVFAWQVIPGTPLIAAGNRDEFYDRPATPADWWQDHPHVYAGRDLKGGGTWMGVTRDGRFAAITNIRAPSETRADAPSRGRLVADYLSGSASAAHYIGQIGAGAERYNGFNLLVGDRDQLIWYSNRAVDDERNGKPLAPGVYGLSNAGLDASWPKVVRTKAQFSSLLCQCAPEEAFFEMLSDTTRASDCRLPKTGVSIELERMLSAVYIESADYGTRSSTVVKLAANDEPLLYERLLK
ncbi:NRDE family protein [Janthinobacterium sp. 17J80-10]|uniref:NRDE family protein n=1 Tax=Janthinobacterium sp. 17J80-10 TaxID=2497863 RepID=UPI0010052D6B|nr:NRDE family protein [Janthinobacterium sp. 17J80-10]QAU34594.1 NRDE family protein [Janthinobacterium sp. 17J80-10]